MIENIKGELSNTATPSTPNGSDVYSQ